MSKELQKYADVAMFKADPIDQNQGPQVTLLSCNPDPLGTIAAAALMYEGKSVQSLADITDEQRHYYLEQTAKTALAAPLEFVNFHFIISGVTRGFTHQMVRQRTATYTQESTRFAVKEDVPVGRPPSLDGTVPWAQWTKQCYDELFGTDLIPWQEQDARWKLAQQHAEKQATPEQWWRRVWDDTVQKIDSSYNYLVNANMPAEDARGLLPTNLLTRINYNSSLRGLLEHSGVRLCTQAQFEWRLVWTKIKEAIVEYGKKATYVIEGTVNMPSENVPHMLYAYGNHYDLSAAWQFEELAKIFKPICYQKGSCQFNADVDRACSIKGRVRANELIARPSSLWGQASEVVTTQDVPAGYRVAPIKDEEWMLDPAAARVSQ